MADHRSPYSALALRRLFCRWGGHRYDETARRLLTVNGFAPMMVCLRCGHEEGAK